MHLAPLPFRAPPATLAPAMSEPAPVFPPVPAPEDFDQRVILHDVSWELVVVERTRAAPLLRLSFRGM